MAKRTKKRGAFFKGMLIYALVVIALLPAGLRPLWRYLAAYEESGADKAMEHYLEGLDAPKLRALARPFLAGLELRWQTEEQALDEVDKLLDGELRFGLKSASTDLKAATYNVRSGKLLLGTVSLAKGEDPPFGFAPWEVTEESFDFSALLHDEELTVPSSWTVSCNGVALGQEDRTGEALPFALLRSFYSDSRFDLPKLVTYRVSGVVGEAPLTIRDPEGREQPRGADFTEEQMLANCTAEEEAEIRTLMDGFLQRYVDCLSNASKNVNANYNALKPYIVAGSGIDKTIKDNMEGQRYAHSTGDTVNSREDLLLMDLGGGYYLAELEYALTTRNREGVSTDTLNRALVIMTRTNAGLRVIEVYPL